MGAGGGEATDLIIFSAIVMPKHLPMKCVLFTLLSFNLF